MDKYAIIKGLQAGHPVKPLCQAFEVSTSGYYSWLQSPYTQKRQADARLAVAIEAAHERTRHTYGSCRLQAELAGVSTGLGVSAGSEASVVSK
jgi:putative transposase